MKLQYFHNAPILAKENIYCYIKNKCKENINIYIEKCSKYTL
jgi:hypothetical protein